MINVVYNFFFHAVTTMSNFVFKNRLLLRIDDFFLFKLEFFFIFYQQFENQNAKICPIASLYMNICSEPPELMGFGDMGTSPHQLLTDKLTGRGGGSDYAHYIGLSPPRFLKFLRPCCYVITDGHLFHGWGKNMSLTGSYDLVRYNCLLRFVQNILGIKQKIVEDFQRWDVIGLPICLAFLQLITVS